MKQFFEHHLNVNTVGVNRIPPHNFFIPRNAEEPFENGYGGKRFFSLDGQWDFDLFENEEDRAARERNGFRSVPVPSCWQFYSFDPAAYVNDKYTFPYDPPRIPKDGMFGVYEKTFDFFPESNRVYRLFFEGADSCLYVFLNGEFVGYSEISHSVSEFDVTAFIKAGKNLLSVRIYKYSTGSYLENQDKIRLNGLFGSVYLVARDFQHIQNYQITYTLEKGGARVHFAFSGCNKIKKVIIKDGEQCAGAEGVDACDIALEKIALWNSEIPKRYRVEILCGEEKICDYIAFRTVSIKNGIFLINGKPVKLHGVNRHSYACETGYYVPDKVMRRDIRLMKNCGINAVRTSHYPPSPAFIELCEEHGLYVVEEADIETHGVVKMNGGHQEALFDAITESDDFAFSIRARIESMTARDCNRGCVIMWSAGNEAGYGKHMIEEIRRLQKSDPSRLVHYESLYTRFPERNCYRLPIVSKMYAAPADLKKLLREEDRPVMLCEYSHSMGNSCGDLGEYYELFGSEPKMMGGFVWEWNDQAFPLGGARMGYGGDFGEPVNDGNFCLDGLLDEKREPKSAYFELRNLNCPLSVVREGEGYALKNKSVFETLSPDTVRAVCTHKDGSEEIDYGKLEPDAQTTLALIKDEIYNFTFVRGGEVIGTARIGKLCPQPPVFRKEKAEISSRNGCDILRGGGLEVQIGKRSGLPARILSGGVVRLESCKLRAVRAPLDNDAYVKESWRLRGLFRTYTLAERGEGDGTLRYPIRLCADGVGNLFEGNIAYELSREALKISLRGNVNENIEYLPRFGLEFSLPQAFQKFSYLGHGPHECYADKQNLAQTGRFFADLKDEYVYLRPQEANSHFDTAEVKIDTMRFTADRLFSFNYSSYSIERLTSARHSYDLKKEGATRLILDYQMSGVGSGSCGPALNRRFALTDKRIAIDYFIEF